MEKISWLSKHSNASMVIFDIVIDIKSLAKAFSITGNVHISESLKTIAFDIDKETKDMSDAIGECISEELKRSSESTKAILEAALAGVQLIKKS